MSKKIKKSKLKKKRGGKTINEVGASLHKAWELGHKLSKEKENQGLDPDWVSSNTNEGEVGIKGESEYNFGNTEQGLHDVWKFKHGFNSFF